MNKRFLYIYRYLCYQQLNISLRYVKRFFFNCCELIGKLSIDNDIIFLSSNEEIIDTSFKEAYQYTISSLFFRHFVRNFYRLTDIELKFVDNNYKYCYVELLTSFNKLYHNEKISAYLLLNKI